MFAICTGTTGCSPSQVLPCNFCTTQHSLEDQLRSLTFFGLLTPTFSIPAAQCKESEMSSIGQVLQKVVESFKPPVPVV